MTTASARPSPVRGGRDDRPLVSIRGLRVAVGAVQAGERRRSSSLARGEVLALLGESGSGKSVTLRALLRLHPAAAHAHRRLRSSSTARRAGDGDAASSRNLRGGVVSMIFQEPMPALDPVYTIGQQIAETIRRHESVGAADGAGAGARPARARAHPVPRAAARRLSARDVRRHAPARDDRARARLPAEAAACRRADDGARRHGADPDPAPAARAAARARHGDHLRHPRPRRRRRDRRPHRASCMPGGSSRKARRAISSAARAIPTPSGS